MPLEFGIYVTNTFTYFNSVIFTGENYPSADLADMELELKQMQEALPSKIRAEFNKSDECLDGVSSNDNQLGALHHSAISEIPAPETLLMATTEASDLPNDSVLQLTADEPVTSEGTADRFESLSGKKRRLMESTPVFEDGNASKFSRMLRSRSIEDSIPDDDDVLASILGIELFLVLHLQFFAICSLWYI